VPVRQAGTVRDGGANSDQAETLQDRMRIAADRVGNASALSRVTGISRRSIGEYLAGDAEPSTSRLVAIADAAGVSVEWLATGRGAGPEADGASAASAPPHRVGPAVSGQFIVDANLGLPVEAVPQIAPAVSPAGSAAFAFSDNPERVYVRLPLYLPRASAGHGLAVQNEALAANMIFSVDWLWHTLRRHPDDLILLQAHGDSMEPRIRHGDVLIVDTTAERIRDNGIYCFSYEGDLMVKRLYRNLRTKSLHIVSDNDNYPAQELSADEANRIHVVGLVVWHGGLARG
jgi:phage repressor protein C with HTH and peptisase S24 domain